MTVRSRLSVTITGDERQLRTALDRIHAGQNRVENKFEQVKNKGQQAFGDKALGFLRNYAAGLAGVQIMGQKIVQMFQDIDRAREESAAKARESEMGLGSLQQLALGDPKKLRSLIDATKELYAGGGARSMDEAARTVFSLESAGALDQRALFTQLFGAVEDVAAAARASTTMLTGFGEAETGSIRDILSKGFAASQFAPATMEELLEGATRSATYGALLAWRDEEALSATSVLAKSIGGPGAAAEAGTALAGLGAALVRRSGFEGKDLKQAVREISQMGLSNDELLTFLGEKRAFKGYALLLANMEQYEKVLGEVDKAAAGDFVGKVIASRDYQPELVAAREGRKAQARLEVAEEPIGIARQMSNAVIADWEAQARKEGRSEFSIWAARQTFRYERFVGGEELFMERYGGGEQGVERLRTMQSGDMMSEPWRNPNQGDVAGSSELAKAADNLKQTANGLRGVTIVGAPNED